MDLGFKGFTVKDLAPLAIVFVILAITVGMGSLILGNMQTETYTDNTITNETFNATSDPYTYTANHASDTDFVELTAATCYETSDYLNSTSKLADSACNITDEEAGDIKLSTAVDKGDEAVDYDYHTKSDASGVVGKGNETMETFGSWFPILVVVVIAAVIIGIVMKYFGGVSAKV